MTERWEPAGDSVKMDLELQEFDVPLDSIGLLLSAVEPFEREGIGVRSKRTQSYVSVSAAGGTAVAVYVHKTLVSVALNPDTAIWADQQFAFCKLQEHGKNKSTRYIRMTHDAVRQNPSIALHLFVEALQRSSGHSSPRHRADLERRQSAAAPPRTCHTHSAALVNGICDRCQTDSGASDTGTRIDTVDGFIQSLLNGRALWPGEGPADLDPGWSMREGQIATMLDNIDSTLVIEVISASNGKRYIQASKEFDGLLVEAVSNEFLSPRRFLHPGNVGKLIEWGWSPPSVEDSPNFAKFYPEPWPVAELAREFVLVFRDVYGVTPHDAWGVSPEWLGLMVGGEPFDPTAPQFDDPDYKIETVRPDEIEWVVDPDSLHLPPLDLAPVPDPISARSPRTSGPPANARLVDVVEALSTDLMYAMSRSAQELFHTNTWAWLAESIPHAADALLRAVGSTSARGEGVEVWREYHHLDLLIDPGGAHPKVVIENKLFSVPDPVQLLRYARTPLPWSASHNEEGAANTRYVLLSLLPPSFALPKPWSHLGYDELAAVIDVVADEPGGDEWPLVVHYAHLLRRLSQFAEAVDPRSRPAESFYDWQPEGVDLDHGPFQGIVQKLRFSGLVQMVQAPLSGFPLEFEVNITRGIGLASYHREVMPSRTIGWQLQGDQFRLFVRMTDDGLRGRGPVFKQARSEAAAQEHATWFDFGTAERLLGPLLHPRKPGAKTFLHFDPDFVYQSRTLDHCISTTQLAHLLRQFTLDARSYL